MVVQKFLMVFCSVSNGFFPVYNELPKTFPKTEQRPWCFPPPLYVEFLHLSWLTAHFLAKHRGDRSMNGARRTNFIPSQGMGIILSLVIAIGTAGWAKTPRGSQQIRLVGLLARHAVWLVEVCQPDT